MTFEGWPSGWFSRASGERRIPPSWFVRVDYNGTALLNITAPLPALLPALSRSLSLVDELVTTPADVVLVELRHLRHV